jgi:hypothetical protein
MTRPALSVPLRFVARETPVRRGEPVTVGLPWPRGAVADDRQFHLVGPDGSPQVLQTRVLDRWPDGSVRWCLFDFLATVDGRNDGYRVEARDDHRDTHPASGVSEEQGRVEIHAGGHRSSTGQGLEFPFEGVKTEVNEADIPESVLLFVTSARVVERGPVRTRIHVTGRGQHVQTANPELIAAEAYLDVYTGLPVVRVQQTLRNEQPADHPGGNWDLGNGGSVYLKRFGFTATTSHDGPTTVRLSAERGAAVRTVPGPVRLHQESSGGENWKSSNHLTRNREVPFRYRGYKLTHPGGEAAGLRATPIVTLEQGDRFLGVTMPYFWENFPKTVSADAGTITLDLFPEEPAGETELQGGEQKTHVFSLAFGRDTVTAEPMAWCRSPLLCHADPEWYAATGAIPYLTPKAADPNRDYLALVDQAIEGPDTFLHKREKIDEYGWRNFGDLYGDHEAVFHPGPAPMISHYNNQFDCVAGFLYQFLRSADPRWFAQGVECADHTCDVDVYHTTGDKAAYNGGLFWHTYHYADADTAAHRSYPRALLASGGHMTGGKDLSEMGDVGKNLAKAYAVGGGPGGSHNYNTGLMLAHFLTGNPLYRETAVGLARFVIDMDDPAKTVFRWLSREHTGTATESGERGYHGPGRASANSVNALLVGHQLTGDRAFLDKAEQIIRRVSHPRQDLAALDLLNAELRWFYTMHLQALGRYLDYKADLGELDRMYAYGRLTLLHYARWMAANEHPILDKAAVLQFPTESWAAQEVRKVEAFQFAAKHAAGEEKARFLERAEWFFRYVERTLGSFPTKSLCRPVILMLNFGWSRAWWQAHPDASAPEPAVKVSPEEFGEWRMFVPQKAKAMRRAKVIAVAGAVGFALAVVAGVAWLLS